MLISKQGRPREIMTIEGLMEYCPDLNKTTIINLDLAEIELDWDKLNCKHTTWLGCNFPEGISKKLQKKGAVVFPKITGLPYNPYRSELYTWNELLDGYDDQEDLSTDYSIYRHFSESRHNPPEPEVGRCILPCWKIIPFASLILLCELQQRLPFYIMQTDSKQIYSVSCVYNPSYRSGFLNFDCMFGFAGLLSFFTSQ